MDTGSVKVVFHFWSFPLRRSSEHKKPSPQKPHEMVGFYVGFLESHPVIDRGAVRTTTFVRHEPLVVEKS